MIPTNGRIGVCPGCDCEAELTHDHIIPKWLLVDAARFGVDYADIIEKAGIRGKTWGDLCGPCNLAKGGSILYKNKIVRAYLKSFILAVYDQIKLREYPRKIKVSCGCARKEPCSTTPGTINSPFIVARPEMAQMSPREAHAARS